MFGLMRCEYIFLQQEKGINSYLLNLGKEDVSFPVGVFFFSKEKWRFFFSLRRKTPLLSG